MRKLLLISIATTWLASCVSMKNYPAVGNQVVSGIYTRQESTKKLELKPNGTYTLFNSEQSFTPVFEQCKIASNGKWSIVSNDVIELTSEDKYIKQKGFDYDIKKGSKLSQDSLYIQVIFPADFEPKVKLSFYFNNNVSKSIETEGRLITIPKSKYLWAKSPNSINRNHIAFSVNAIISGITLYKGRVLFKIFEEDIDTERSNYLIITLPNFDRCFFEFEPLNQELIYIKNNNLLFWQGDIWGNKK